MNLTLSTFFYLWYGTPSSDGCWSHWNHSVLPHWTPSVSASYPTIGTSFDPSSGHLHSHYYPKGGPYSSSNSTVLLHQFSTMAAHRIQVAILSWWGRPSLPSTHDTQGVSTDSHLSLAISAASSSGVKVAFHMEPYEGRNITTFIEDVEYLLDRYGDEGALHRVGGKPVFYVYDSYHIPYPDWKAALGELRRVGFFYGLVLTKEDMRGVVEAGFGGGYTYFAQDGFTAGSNSASWPKLCSRLRAGGLKCDISVGPGYNDEKIRPWNSLGSVERSGGSFYVDRLNRALSVRPDGVSITSYNEWGEGTQIEPAGEYEGVYGGEYGEPYDGLYLGLTKKIVTRWRRDNEGEEGEEEGVREGEEGGEGAGGGGPGRDLILTSGLGDTVPEGRQLPLEGRLEGEPAGKVRRIGVIRQGGTERGVHCGFNES
ncbi:hypothetical protein TrCOL_g5774 [Triparma columacea]|uniref:Uncharacterized protein n=1 Tax=Triparma columacea TaxID=722753 RepID=A0A9W7FWI7_9STRA|nr:hypothetical protein TrCOL_g5774 [Triparma columacea]